MIRDISDKKLIVFLCRTCWVERVIRSTSAHISEYDYSFRTDCIINSHGDAPSTLAPSASCSWLYVNAVNSVAILLLFLVVLSKNRIRVRVNIFNCWRKSVHYMLQKI